jgi:hypothetical protein
VKSIQGLGAVEIPGIGMPMRLVCEVKPAVLYDRQILEQQLGSKLPVDLVNLWEAASELRLYEDKQFGQWGLILWPPTDMVYQHSKASSERPEQYARGDVIIGEFRGDQEKLLIRCDESQADYGHVLVALPIYGRCDWPTVSDSLSGFLTSFVNARGNKFWE